MSQDTLGHNCRSARGISGRMPHMLTRALGSAAITIAVLAVAGCSDESRTSGAAPSQADTFGEFFIASDNSFVFERVDRATPDPLVASEGDVCFTDPGWVRDGATYDRGDARPNLPTGTQRGAVNVMKQCELPARA